MLEVGFIVISIALLILIISAAAMGFAMAWEILRNKK